MGGFCLLVELHREGSALQPAQQACFVKVVILVFFLVSFRHINMVVEVTCPN
jgi:hypothetical protein